MQKFEVWAPSAQSIQVQVAGKPYPLKAAQRGYWTADVADAQPGMDYGYIIDGKGPAIPDPRSPWQPDGINGLSRLLDHSSFSWHDQQWQPVPLSSAIIYELHVGTFTPEGTFDAAIGKLDYLKDLGITHVELLPIATGPGDRGWGYDGVALFAPQEAYGGPDAVKRFVDAAHARSLAVINDVVYNHFGPTGNYTGKYGPYLNENHKTPWGGAVNLEDEGSSEVRRFFCDNAHMWLRDYHFDGLRLDAVTAYIDRSAINFLEQLSDEVRMLGALLGKHFFLVAESDLNDPRVVRAPEASGYGMDAQWSDDFHHALWTVLTGESSGYYQDFGSVEQLATALKEVFVYQGEYSEFRKRHHGRPVHDLPAHRFLGYIQNHDQVGNRATGERISHLVSPGKVKIAAALVLTAPFIPMLFQGEEFAASTPFQYFTDHEDVDIARAVSEGRKKEFGGFGWSPSEIPDPQSIDSFNHSKLKWEEITEPRHAEILDWHKKLITLRQQNRTLLDGILRSTHIRFDEDAKWLVLRRGPFQIVCNFAEKSATIKLSNKLSCPTWILLSADPVSKLDGEELTISPESVVIVQSALSD